MDAALGDVYVDGAPFATYEADIPPPRPRRRSIWAATTMTPAYVTKRFFKGTMRDVRIYQRLLTSEEIATLLAAGPSP